MMMTIEIVNPCRVKNPEIKKSLMKKNIVSLMTASTNFPRKKKREVNFLPGFKRRINLHSSLFSAAKKGEIAAAKYGL